MNPPRCPLCSDPDTALFHTDATREYLHCPVCDLVFLHPQSYLSREEEFQRYELHQNDLADPGYRRFLQKLCNPLLERIPAQSRGLDFGSGPGPLLKLMLEEQGHSMALYDPFYAPDLAVLNGSYEFITSTEVLEHLHHPLVELNRLWGCLEPRGYLGIMTSLYTTEIDFSRWHYVKDPTHVLFFTPQTMYWLAHHWGAQLKILDASVIIFNKTA